VLLGYVFRLDWKMMMNIKSVESEKEVDIQRCADTSLHLMVRGAIRSCSDDHVSITGDPYSSIHHALGPGGIMPESVTAEIRNDYDGAQ
jgi:hypothetical protein